MKVEDRADVRAIVRIAEIDRAEPGRRVVFGEVMPAAPDLVPGGTYRQSALDGCIHYDGIFLTAADVRQLADQLTGIAYRVDAQHSNEAISGARIVRVFMAGEDGSPAGRWSPGALVAGVLVEEGSTYRERGEDGKFVQRDTVADIDSGHLAAYSIDFRVQLQRFSVSVVDDNDENPIQTQVARATNPVPVFLSLVTYPATGKSFQMKLTRAVVPFQDLPLADRGDAWNSADATSRVRLWAGGDDLDLAKYRKAFLWYDEASPELLGSYKMPIADVYDDGLRAVPRAIFAAAARIDQLDVPADDLPGIRANLERYYAAMGEEAPWNRAADTCRAADTATTTTEEAMPEPNENETTEREIAHGFVRLLKRALGLGTPEPSASAEAETQDEPEAVARDSEPETEGENVSEAPISEVARADFGAAMKRRELSDELYEGFWFLRELVSEAISDESITDKSTAIKGYIAAFAQWAMAEADKAFAAPQPSVMLSAFLGERPDDVARKGAKMSKARREALEASMAAAQQAVDTLSGLMSEVSDEPEDVAESVQRDAETDADPANSADDAPSTEVSRDLAAEVADVTHHLEAERALREQVQAERAKLEDQLAQLQRENETLRRAPAPSHALRGGPPGAEPDRDKVSQRAEMGRRLLHRDN